jgi:hypothetical protein
MEDPFSFLIACGAVVLITLGCLGPSASDSRCRGTVKVGSTSWIGEAKNEEQAGLNACNKYCLDEDEKAKGMIRDWLASDAAAEFERKFKRKPTKEDAAIEDKATLEYVTRTCAVRCKAEANKGRHSLETSCK